MPYWNKASQHTDPLALLWSLYWDHRTSFIAAVTTSIGCHVPWLLPLYSPGSVFHVAIYRMTRWLLRLLMAFMRGGRGAWSISTSLMITRLRLSPYRFSRPRLMGVLCVIVGFCMWFWFRMAAVTSSVVRWCGRLWMGVGRLAGIAGK